MLFKNPQTGMTQMPVDAIIIEDALSVPSQNVPLEHVLARRVDKLMAVMARVATQMSPEQQIAIAKLFGYVPEE